ncbi:MAG: sulfotransferase domain-containing protein, partial [Phycisphaerales bacterium]|nr:sulfotransferase domain-containing protein [Phycisphaerales bacterium]
ARKVRAAVAGLTGSAPAQPFRDDLTYLFISGCARSGTNWLSALVNLHPHALADGEFKLQWVGDGVERATRNPWNVAARVPAAGDAMRRHLDAMVREAMQAAFPIRPQTRVLADHSPVPFHPMLSPEQARHVVIIRDGRDVLVSWTYHALRNARPNFVLRTLREAYKGALATLDGTDHALKQAARTLLLNPEWVWRYADDWSRRIADDDERLAALDDATRRTCLVLRYEDLHADVDARRADIYRLCGLDPDLAPATSHHSNTAPGFATERPGEMLRKGQSGDWRNYFTRATAQAFHARAGTALATHGYEPTGDWVSTVPESLPSRPDTQTSEFGPAVQTLPVSPVPTH